ncbi:MULTISPECIES: carbohydrate ABC transporter permease [Paenibacillus]|jgi:putative aldouronate transport system permease protein|uniref:Carbohydrate ABC transporter permease n=1 Tax=Paenibacillus baimaensis TaxID=2982185 RepID=A0ABT2UD80_9BACL|nr:MULTISPECIES: carbohydrate ABC transporter permease [unclassified Paenibacillus]MCU6791634.1 carbohydrate ABC transporter permease [Paenibacillus sp. WQ 127069]OMF16292.1 ABC transporter permease [Paenibacillus sp. FSL H7-0331]
MKPTWGEKLFYQVNAILLGLAALSALLPLFNILSLSLSSNHAILAGKVTFLPVEFTLSSYAALLKGTRVPEAFMNSLIITFVGVAFNMIFTVLAAYPLSRSNFIGRRPMTLLIIFTMLFSGGLIPSYLLIKSLGILNSYWSLWLPGLVSAYNMLIMKSFFENIPEELVDAARMDGCGEWRLAVQIILPLSTPVLATMALFYGVSHWNSFMNVLIYIQDSSKYNLSVLIQQMVAQSNMMNELQNLQEQDMVLLTPESIKSAGMMVMLMPMIIAYPFLQKYFVKGVLIGAVKG